MLTPTPVRARAARAPARLLACALRPAPSRLRAQLTPACAAPRPCPRAGGGVEVATSITGAELRALVVAKWGRPYDTRLCQRRDRFNVLKMYLQVMWKFQGQKSFPLSEAAYMEQLDAVAELLSEWGVVEEARKGIDAATLQPKVDTVGATAVMIPLSVDVGP